MLDVRKVKLMTKLAMYESTQGKEDFKISEYYRKDYVGFHTLWSVLWVTIGFVCIAALAMVAGLDALLEQMSKSFLITLGLGTVISFVVVLIIYAVVSNHVYNQKHKQARQRVKIFNHNLTRLLKYYEKERK